MTASFFNKIIDITYATIELPTAANNLKVFDVSKLYLLIKRQIIIIGKQLNKIIFKFLVIIRILHIFLPYCIHIINIINSESIVVIAAAFSSNIGIRK